MNQKNLWVKTIALALCTALLLCGCGGKSGGGFNTSKSDASASSSGDTSGDTSSETSKDYSKYNAYMELYNQLSDMEDILLDYFVNVDYTEEFSLVEGGDYAAIKDSVEYHFFICHHILPFAND